MADLPIEIISSDISPFTCVGTDCFGPFLGERGRSTRDPQLQVAENFSYL